MWAALSWQHVYLQLKIDEVYESFHELARAKSVRVIQQNQPGQTHRAKQKVIILGKN